MKKLSILLFILLTYHHLQAQDVPNCDASTLQLKSLEVGFTEVTAHLLMSASEEIITYDVQHDFMLAGQPVSEVISSETPTVSISFAPSGLHTFTALNRCTDGTTHTGSTFSIDFGQDSLDLDCPVPTNLVIDLFNPAFVQFHWDVADSVDFWQVTYQPEGLVPQTFTVPEPFVEQVLASTVRHTFSLFAVCDDEMFAPPLTVTQSPTVTFSLIVIEDVKLLPILCDSLTILTWDAYHMQCTEHGEFGPNKEAYVFTHNCEACLTATNLLQPGADGYRWRIYPNPTAGDLWLEYRLPLTAPVRFSIYDLLGRSVLHSPMELAYANGWQQSELSLASLPAASYWLVGQLGERTFVQKIVRQ